MHHVRGAGGGGYLILYAIEKGSRIKPTATSTKTQFLRTLPFASLQYKKTMLKIPKKRTNKNYNVPASDEDEVVNV